MPSSFAPATSKSAPDCETIFFARCSRFSIDASVVKNALAISATEKPQRMFKMSVTCPIAASFGWQHENIMRS